MEVQGDRAEAEAGMALALARALGASARDAAAGPAELVSITCDLLAHPEPGEPFGAEVEIVRATRTLVFARAQLRGSGGRRLMAAASVHRIKT